MTRPEGRERRRAPRVRASFPIRVRCEQGDLDGVMRDLSAVGLCCRLPVALREMTLVKMRLDLPGQARGVEVEGVVVRAEKLPNASPATYDIAVFFSAIEQRTRSAIEMFAEAQTSAASG